MSFNPAGEDKEKEKTADKNDRNGFIQESDEA